jgi:MFS family permease
MRNVLILAISQALGGAGATLVVLVGGIVGAALAPDDSLATLPIATLVVGTALTTIPAALWMRRAGRRIGFITGAALALSGALIGARALMVNNFLLLCACTLLVGASLAFVQQYRFAAIESVPAARAGRAVSTVLLGGIVAGLLGPEIARGARDWLPQPYVGSFLALAALYVVLILVMAAFRNVSLEQQGSADEAPRPLRTVANQPDFRLAVGAALIAYTVMSFVMTATPLSMHVVDGHSLDATAHVIQAHVIGMFTPSLFSGFLIDRLGVRRLMIAGVLAMIGAIAVAASSHQVATYGVSLALLGIGWNFLFVGGTVLLTRTYRPAERFRTQAFNDFLIFTAQAIASVGAGAALRQVGWTSVNLVMLPLLLIMIGLIVLRRDRVGSGGPAPA